VKNINTLQHDPDQCFQIHALVNTYNDHISLPFTLNSIRDVVDTIIVADGAYEAYYKTYRKFEKDAKPWSTDSTLQMLKIIPKLPPIKLIECPNHKPWKNQCVKRTALLDAVPSKDWFIIVDCDEMLFGDVTRGINEIMGSGCIAGRVPLYNVGLDVSGYVPFWHPRIFLKLPGMHYSRKHWLLCDFAERVIEMEYPVWTSDAFVLTHLKVLKHYRRLAPHQSYMNKMSTLGWLEPNAPQFKLEKEVREQQ